MKLLRRLLGLDVPDPAPAQVWWSGHNGKLMLVHRIDVSASGWISIHCCTWIEAGEWSGLGPGWGIASLYASSLREWRLNLRDERRHLCVPLPAQVVAAARAPLSGVPQVSPP